MTTYAEKDVGNTLTLLLGVQSGMITLDFSLEISQKIREQPTSRLINTTFEYTPKGCLLVPQEL